MINKALQNDPGMVAPDDPLSGIDIEIILDETGEPLAPTEDQEDVVVDLSTIPHAENLAAYVQEDTTTKLISMIRTRIDRDNEARTGWLETMAEGYKLLGTAIERRKTPWDGACGAHSSLLLETLVRFVAEAGNESWPSSGPVRGSNTPASDEVLAASLRVEKRLNSYLTVENRGARSEHEKTLFSCGLTGSGFKKMYLGADNEPVCEYIPADHIILPSGASDLRTSPYFTHNLRIFHEDYKRAVRSGMYLDIDLKEPETSTPDSDYEVTDRARDRASGLDNLTGDIRHNFYETHIDLDADELPDGQTAPRRYIVTFDKSSEKLLSIYRGWDETDPKQKPVPVFVQYIYLYGDTPYGFGLVHLLGNATHTSTMAIRNLVDAATLSNLPAGYKTKSARFTGDNQPLKPGEFRDVELTMGPLKDAFMPLPFKEPSQVLFNMLLSIGEEARRFVSTADLSLQDMPDNSGSMGTLGVLEKAAKYNAAIMTRLYAAMSEEFDYIKRLLSASDLIPETSQYPDDATKQDFANARIIPVADAKNATQAQRLSTIQAAQNYGMALAPELVEKRALLLEGFRILGLEQPERYIIPPPQEVPPQEPVAENMSILNGAPVKAFPPQDHQAHIRAHQAFLQDPQIQAMLQNSPAAEMIMGAMDAHLREHFAFDYMRRVEASLGTALPQNIDGIDPTAAGTIAQAADIALGKAQQLAQAQEAAARMQDPIIQQQDRELTIKEGELRNRERKVEYDRQIDLLNLALNARKVNSDVSKALVDSITQLKQLEDTPDEKEET